MRIFHLIFILIISWGYGQNGYQIKIKTKNLENKTLQLSLYRGNYKKIYTIDSVKIKTNDEVVTFKQSKKIIPTIYQLHIKEQTGKMDLAMDNNVRIELVMNDEFISSLTTTHPINRSFFDYQKMTDPEQKKQWIQKTAQDKNKNSLQFFALLEQKKLLQVKPNEKDFGRMEFLKGVDLNNKAMMIAPNSYSFLNSYFQLGPIDPKNYKASVDLLLKNKNCQSPNYLFYLDWIFKNIEFHEKINLNETREKIFYEYLNQTECIKMNPKLHASVLDKIRNTDSYPIGSSFPDFEVKNKEGKVFPISEIIKGKNAFIVFYDPLCDGCVKEVPNIANFIKENEEKYGEKVVKIAFINSPSKSDWNSFIEKSGIQNWIHIENTEKSKNYATDLNVLTNPNYYIIDSAGKVVSKRYNKADLNRFYQLK